MTTTISIAKTPLGSLKGYCADGIHTFLGVKYANAKRFQMPTPVEPWEGEKEAFAYGWASPTLMGNRPQDETLMPLRFWPEREDCQYLNIWTNGLTGKRPVMVWIHGGGYAAGSGMEHTYYEGTNLARDGDVVVVTLNHRLNIFGYMDLSPFGEKYAHSSNAGNADIIMALRWVRTNIASFGGDPDNVTIFGQSGGGMKIQNILQCSAADGLYHRAVIQSGVLPIGAKDDGGKQDGRRIVEALMSDLGLSAVEELETVETRRLIDSYNKVAPALRKEGCYVGGSPIPDDLFLGDPLKTGFTEYAKQVPLMVGTTFAEFTYTQARRDKYELSEAEQRSWLAERYGDKTDEAIAIFRKAWPDKNLCDLPIADEICRSGAVEFAKAKAAVSSAPVYCYLYSYECAMEHTTAWHCGEIPFVFRNTDKVVRLLEEGVSDHLQDQISGAWLAFARTGCPQTADLPDWAPCTGEQDITMVFDRTCRAGADFDKAFRAYMSVNFPQHFPSHP